MTLFLNRSRLALGLTLFVFGCVGWGYLNYLKASRQQVGLELAHNFSLHTVERIRTTVTPVYMLASVVKQSHGVVPNFDELGAEFIREFPYVRAVELAPAGVVRKVYPLRDNRQVIGHDLLKDRERNKDAYTAIAKRELMLAGPFELIQGGVGVVARYPVYLADSSGKETFWGFTIVLIHIEDMLSNIGGNSLREMGYNYQLCRVMSVEKGTTCKVFTTSKQQGLDDPVVLNINLPNAQWVLSVQPDAGWVSSMELMGVVLAVLISSLLAWRSGVLWIRKQVQEDEGGA
jgi:sensor domain CHASE-containing protein